MANAASWRRAPTSPLKSTSPHVSWKNVTHIRWRQAALSCRQDAPNRPINYSLNPFSAHSRLGIHFDFIVFHCNIPAISSSAPVTAAAHWALSSRSQLPLPRMDTNACKTTTCPLVEGNRQTYTYHLFVSSGYPPVNQPHTTQWNLKFIFFFFETVLQRNYNVKWTLTARPFVMCIFFPIKIVN